jgi:uncharacterized membrane protein
MGKEHLDHVFTPEALNRLKKAIAQAELNTSGQLRLHVEAYCKEDVLDHAAFIFEKLEMHKTQERNGVLLYFALLDHKFAIIGDAGIHAKVPDAFWDRLRDEMGAFFKRGAYIEGLEFGILKAGEELERDFPKTSNGNNELPDDVSFVH